MAERFALFSTDLLLVLITGGTPVNAWYDYVDVPMIPASQQLLLSTMLSIY